MGIRMDFSNRVSSIVAVALLATLGGMAYLSLTQHSAALRETRRGELAAVATLLRSALWNTAAVARAEAEIVAHERGIIDAVSQNDRSNVEVQLKDTFTYLNTQAAVNVFQFQTADFKTLVRFQDPSRFGDDVSASRPMVVAVNRSRRGQSGIEIGPTGIAIRGVAPVLKGDQLVGTAEVGFSVGPLLQTAKDTTGSDAAIILSAAMTGSPAAGGHLHGDLTIADSTDSRLFESLLEKGRITLSRDEKQIDAEVNGDAYVIHAQPLLDFSGRMIGCLLGAKNVSASEVTFQRQAYLMLFVALCGLVAAYSVILITFRAFVLAPLEALSKYAQKLARASPDIEAPHLGGVAEVSRQLAPVTEALNAIVASARGKLASQGDGR